MSRATPPASQGIGLTSLRTRSRMVDRLREQGVGDERVLTAMLDVPRHAFVEEALSSRAYEDAALPLGFGQSISRPLTVARMVDMLMAGRELGRTLEVGTGCGYQTAILCRLTREVFSVERVGSLLQRARGNLRPLGIGNARLVHADGAAGLVEAAPFDSIIVSASAAAVPQPLLDQMAVGGRLVMPVGVRDQHLLLVERGARGYSETRMEAVRFVPLMPGKG